MHHYRPQNMTLQETVDYFAANFCTTMDNGCIEIHGIVTNNHGYTHIWFGDTMVLSHRLFYMAHVGPIPEGMFLCHKCDNPLCVNPAHMFIGTQTDNMRDMANKGRTGVRHGSSNHVAKLTESDVLAIRERAAAGEVLNTMAIEYGVTSIVISKIVRGLSWKHVGGPLTNIGKGTRVGIFHGSDNRFAKFTEDDIREIRRLAATGEYTKAKIAKMYNTTDANISKIVLRQSWRHVE